jgi:hypothetical protein
MYSGEGRCGNGWRNGAHYWCWLNSADGSEKLEPEKVKDKPLCMASYKYL